MRILLVSDLHYRLPVLDWLVAAAEGVDALVIAGDLLDVANDVPLEAQIVVVGTYLERLTSRTTVLVSSGNHDLDGPGVHGEQVAQWLQRLRRPGLHTDGDTVDLDAVRFTVCPWWDGPVTRGLVDAQLQAAEQDRPAWWIWIYHSPPAGTPLCHDGRRSFPDHDLRGWIEAYQPSAVLCGHIHQAPWAPGGSWSAQIDRTWVFNAGYLRSRVPPVVMLDTEAGRAQWFGAAGEEPETRQMSAPG